MKAAHPRPPLPAAASALAARLIRRERPALAVAPLPACSRSRFATSLPRAVVAWTTIFALYLQLVAAALCLGGSPAATAGPIASPICHGQANSGSTDDRGQPAGGGCPFCSLHGDLALALAAPTPRPADPTPIVGERRQPRPSAAPALSRRLTDAAPRGPPAAA